LTYHLLKSSGLNVGLAGNVGFSLARQVAEEDKEYFVVELSSFQLDGMSKSKLHIAVLLNITPDHLNRYDNDFSKYVDSKFRIISNMQKGDYFIYNSDDQRISERINGLNSHVGKQSVSLTKSETAVAYLTDKYLMFQDGPTTKRVSRDGLTLRGKHNMINSMVAIQVARNLGISWNNILQDVQTFENVPHRLEYSGEINGVEFYNDSKATNVDAVWYALESFDRPIVLIMGGTDKGNDYTQIDELVKQKVKAIVALGIDNTKIESHFNSFVTDISSTDSVFQAVQIAYSKAKKDDVVLLSPACASFDLFKNYEKRGERFKEAVEGLKGKVEGNLMMVL
jgi:UDP-N-acetylmuramoylalanine--D-glutamate ligase